MMMGRGLNGTLNLRSSGARMALPVHPYASVHQHAQGANAQGPYKINQLHNIFVCLGFSLQRSKTKAAAINKIVAPPPMVNSRARGTS